jgi:hypothetical protein
MKMRLVQFTGIALELAAVSATAEKPLKDYSFIRGVNYSMNGKRGNSYHVNSFVICLI